MREKSGQCLGVGVRGPGQQVLSSTCSSHSAAGRLPMPVPVPMLGWGAGAHLWVAGGGQGQEGVVQCVWRSVGAPEGGKSGRGLAGDGLWPGLEVVGGRLHTGLGEILAA